MMLGKQTYYSGTDGDFYFLDDREKKKSQLFIEMIKANDLRESGTQFERMLLLVGFHQSPIACQAKITDRVKNIFGLCFVLYQESTSFQDINLLFKCQQLFGVFHKRTKKWPALVRYIPYEREAAAGSIECKGTILF